MFYYRFWVHTLPKLVEPRREGVHGHLEALESAPNGFQYADLLFSPTCSVQNAFETTFKSFIFRGGGSEGFPQKTLVFLVGMLRFPKDTRFRSSRFAL